jgi:hypothetical protein
MYGLNIEMVMAVDVLPGLLRHQLVVPHTLHTTLCIKTQTTLVRDQDLNSLHLLIFQLISIAKDL